MLRPSRRFARESEDVDPDTLIEAMDGCARRSTPAS